MFRDKEQELDRLSSELLAEEAEEAQQREEDWVDEALFGDQIADANASDVYRNFSNDYGESVDAYNADHTDLSPDELSEKLNEERVNNRGLVITACCLLALIAAVAVYWLVRFL